MGKSDKPDIEYRFFDHVQYIEGFIDKMKLKDITLVVRNWGSSLGFHYAMRNEDKIRGIAFMEAILVPIESWDMLHEERRKIFQAFRTPDVGWALFGYSILNLLISETILDCSSSLYLPA
jgi:haloalkane dehalogenase